MHTFRSLIHQCSFFCNVIVLIMQIFLSSTGFHLHYFWQLWPEKFQNKTNGVTPRRWIRFCNPDLSRLITKCFGTEDWVKNTEMLVTLQKVKCHT